MSRFKRLVTPWALVSALAAWSLFFVACVTDTSRTLTAPGHTPDAKLVGASECAVCHAEVVAKFVSSSHARLGTEAVDKEAAVACEACHGPGSKHIAAGGGKGTIINPSKTPETCFKCHLDKRGQFALPNSHPIKSGKMTCTECHDPHEGNAIKGAGSMSLDAETATCTRCHVAQKGPFVFKHNAMKEGCTACHNPHGSVNAKMLVARDANLCVKCHLEASAVPMNGTIVIGGEDHRSRLINGNCWTAGCHEAVHGSNASKALRY